MAKQPPRQAIPFPGPQQQQQKPPEVPSDVDRPVVIVESPYSGVNLEKNIAFARGVLRYYALAGFAPFMSHLLYPGALDDDNSRERQIGIHCGLSIGARTGTWIVFALPPWQEALTRGMSLAHDFYKDVLGKPCFFARFNEDGTELLGGEWR